jgi:uncharacterized protein YbjT (DUF2867 family)
MTVMVAGASGVVGRAVVGALVGRDEVRATVRRAHAAEPLRALGAKVTVRDVDTADALTEVLPRCHTLVHLIGGPNQDTDDEVVAANHGSVLTAIAAAREAKVRRMILVSVPGADPDAGHPYVRAKGLAEEAVAASGMEYAIIRSAHVYGIGGFWFTAAVQGALAEPPFVVGEGSQELAPVLAEDLAAVIAAVDNRSAVPAGTWAVEGPDAVTADAFVQLLRAGHMPARTEHAEGSAAAERLEELLGVSVLRSAASFLAMPSRATDASDAFEAFAVERTPMIDGLRRTIERGAALHHAG